MHVHAHKLCCAHELCTRAEPCDWSAGAHGVTTMLGVSLRARRHTTQVMLGVSVRARRDTTLASTASTSSLNDRKIQIPTNAATVTKTGYQAMKYISRELKKDGRH